MVWNTLFHPLPYYTAPTTPNSRLLTPLVYLYWAVICCVLLPLAPIYLFTSLVGTIYISTQMGWRLKQTKPEVVEDIKKRYLGSVTVTPVVEPTPVAEPTPVTESPSVAEPTPVAEPASVAEPTPVTEPAPVAGSPSVAEPTPVTEVAPIVFKAAQNVVSVEEVVEGKGRSEDDASIVPPAVAEEVEAEEIVPLAIEPTLTAEESLATPHEPTSIVHEEAQTETHEEIPQVLAKQESLTVREYSSPVVEGPYLEDVGEISTAPLQKAREPIEETKGVYSCSMMESKSTTESAPSDYSESTSSDIEESDEDEFGESKHKEEQGLEGIMEEEEEADEEILRKDLDEREVSDQELTPQAPEYSEYSPSIPQTKPEEPAFVPAPRVYGPPAFGICEKRGIREIFDPRERHSLRAWMRQPVSVSVEESLASSDESSLYDDESERDGSPPISPISSIGGASNGRGIIGNLELDIGVEKAESVEDDVDTPVIPAPLAPQKTETPQVTEVTEAPASGVKEVPPCVALVEPIPTAIEPEKKATIVDEQKLIPVAGIAPKLERSNTDDSGFESGSVKEVKVQKKKKKTPMKQRLGNKKSKRNW